MFFFFSFLYSLCFGDCFYFALVFPTGLKCVTVSHCTTFTMKNVGVFVVLLTSRKQK